VFKDDNLMCYDSVIRRNGSELCGDATRQGIADSTVRQSAGGSGNVPGASIFNQFNLMISVTFLVEATRTVRLIVAEQRLSSLRFGLSFVRSRLSALRSMTDYGEPVHAGSDTRRCRFHPGVF
jgi:hypothetical protein